MSLLRYLSLKRGQTDYQIIFVHSFTSEIENEAVDEMFMIFLLGAALAVSAEGMLVKSWGTQSYNKRLAWSTSQLLQDSLDMINLGNPEKVTGVEGFKRYISVEDPLNSLGRGLDVEFTAFNFWLKDLTLNTTNMRQFGSSGGNLRRFIMTGAEKVVHGKDHKDHQLELITCDNCFSLDAEGVSFGYTVSMLWKNDSNYVAYESPLRYTGSFQLSVAKQFNETTGRYICLVDFPGLNLFVDQLPAEKVIGGSMSVSFLADYLHDWVSSHLSSTVKESLQSRITSGMNNLIGESDMCRGFLSSGIFTKNM